MKYIIMADGKGTRWNNYLDKPKHLIEINGEILIQRTIRLLNKYAPDSKVIVTSHDKRYNFDGATRYEPKHNILEIDRFTEELIEDDICFLYGDTYYTENTLKKIINSKTDDILFFGNEKSIVAILIKNSKLFKYHVDNVRKLFLDNKIKACKGWHVYQSFLGLEFDKKQIKEKYVVIDENTTDYNTPEEYEKVKEKGLKL